MSPRHILETARQRGLGLIAVTDHNTTRNVRTCVELGNEAGIFVLPGCEVTTREEVHCLAYFPDMEAMDEFQAYLDRYLPCVKNDPSYFGYQVAVNRDDEIVYEEERLLVMALEQDIESVAGTTHALGGIFVPAHIDRPKNSVFSQLGFIPAGLSYDALELSMHTSAVAFGQCHPELNGQLFLRNSDAHYPGDIAAAYSCFNIDALNWEEIRAAFAPGSSRIRITG